MNNALCISPYLKIGIHTPGPQSSMLILVEQKMSIIQTNKVFELVNM